MVTFNYALKPDATCECGHRWSIHAYGKFCENCHCHEYDWNGDETTTIDAPATYQIGPDGIIR